jgi:hypothetical protein
MSPCGLGTIGKRLDSSVNFGRLSTVMRVPKSYLSRVLHGKADLNSDQFFLAMEYLSLNVNERLYLTLLLEYARTALPKRREMLSEEIDQIQRREFEVKEHLSLTKIDATQQGMADYYLDPINQLVHIAISIDRYRKEVTLLARDLEMQVKKIHAAILKLEQLGLVERKKGVINVLVRNIHLPRESSVFRAWRSRSRLLSFGRIENLPDEDAYNFSAVFSATNEVRTRIHSKILQLLKESESMIKNAKPARVFQLGFDLFPWTNEK